MQFPNYISPNSGFTLIELSIVLVIIGLIVGGVLVGREMIYSAEIRAEISMIQKYQTAANTFRLKYNCLPGDCDAATQLGLGTSGNGDGQLCAKLSPFSANCTQNDDEPFQFWAQLGNAQLIDGSYAGVMGWSLGGNCTIPGRNTPVSKLHPDVGIAPIYWSNVNYIYDNFSPAASDTVSGHIFSLGYGNPYSTLFDAGYTPNEVFTIDSKIDDGKPGTGKIMTWVTGGWDTCATSGVSPQTSVYKLTAAYASVPKKCSIQVINAF